MTNNIDLRILFENQNLLVIDKPFGVVVNRADTVKEKTVQDWAETKFIVRSSQFVVEDKDFYDRSGIVHRIDKETSGCLLLAKNPESFHLLQSFFKNRLVKKEYLALVHGKVVSSEGTINVPIARLPWNREKFGVVPGGKEAITDYKIEKFYQKGKEIFSLVKVFPQTGRTHQIRVHFKYFGFPLVGDYLYAGRKMQVHDRKWCPRVFLHSAKITFPDPSDQNKLISVESPIPEDLKSILNSLQQIESPKT